MITYVPAIASGCWAGYELVTFIMQNRWNFLLRLFSGIPIGLLYQSFFVFIVQYFINWSFSQGMLVISCCSGFAFVLHVMNLKFKPSYKIIIKPIDIMFVIIYSVFIVYRLHLVYFELGEFTRGSCYSDFSFHLELITSFAFGCNRERTSLLDFDSIFSAGDRLAYPVLPNFHASFLLASCGASIPDSMKWTAYLIGVSLVYLMYSLTLTFTKSSLATILAFPLWAFSGGLGFLELFDGPDETHTSNYIHQFRTFPVFWFQSMTHIYHPQRSATYAIPICYMAILALLHGVKKFDWRFFVMAAIAVGITPQTQVHAYAALAAFSIALALLTLPYKGKKKDIIRAITCWAIFGILANLIAFPLCYPYFIRTSQSEGFIELKPIWKDKNYTTSKFAFYDIWWKALGVFGMISLIFGFATASLYQIRIYCAALAVFLMSSAIMFQPWELDNCKLFQDGWMPLSLGFVSQFFAYLLIKSSSIFIDVIVVILYTICIMSGVINMATYEGYRGTLYGIYEKDSGRWISENTPKYSVFQSERHVVIPSSVYAGRSLYVGYPGWLSSHGLYNHTKMEISEKMINGVETINFQRHNVSYILRVGSINSLPKYDELPEFELLMSIGPYHLWKYINDSSKVELKIDEKQIKSKKSKTLNRDAF